MLHTALPPKHSEQRVGRLNFEASAPNPTKSNKFLFSTFYLSGW
jgi:hypothetical protein